MADSKLVNEHRAWLKDAEKGKTRACIVAIIFFLYNVVMLFSGEFAVFFIFLITLMSLISSLTVFFGKSAGRGWMFVTELIVIVGVCLPFFASEEINFFGMFVAVGINFWLPLVCIIFSFANFYMRRYFTFMTAYKANKIYL